MNLKTAFVYLPYAVLLVTFAAFVLRCRFRVRVQAIWAIVLLTCFSKFLCFREFGGDAFNPEMPERVIWVWNWAYSGACILCLLAVPLAFFRLPGRAFVLPILAWSISAWGVWNGIRPPQVKEITLTYADLPASLDGYRIVQLADLHISSAARRWRTERIVDAANACKGDLTVITGDIVDGETSSRLPDVMPLRKLKARDGVYAVTGNHEAYFDFLAWLPWFEQWGIRFLSCTCACPHEGLALGGVDDLSFPELHEHEPSYKSFKTDVAKAFSAAPKGTFRILLQHRPSRFRENVAQQGVRLQLSGHTHGGVMPLMRTFVARHNRGFVRGLYTSTVQPLTSNLQPAFLYVSPGANQWAGFPVRFFNPSEITVITLRHAKQ